MVCRKPVGLREVHIIQRMRNLLCVTITQIALAVDRSRTAVYRALDISPNRGSMPRRDRPPALTKKQVTSPVITKRARVKCPDRTLRKASAKKGVEFRRLRAKPLLTKADRRERLAFARKYKDKPTSFWLKSVHMHIDCKTFPVYVTARGRLHAATREVRGACRQRCEGLADGNVVQPKELRFNPGCKAVKIIAGVGMERRMAKSKRETRAEFTRRLHRAARLALSQDFLKKSIVAMKRRCRLLFEAKGVYFQEDAQRQRVHFSHARTWPPADQQPRDLTREGFWKHLEQVYLDAYPEAANASGSILMFGAVAEEAHAAGHDGRRDLHRHAACYTSSRHYWRKVAAISHRRFGVKLKAVAREGYYSMYSYLTVATPKKPHSELDQELFLSQMHPRGEASRKLLEAGQLFSRANARKRRAHETGQTRAKSVRPGDAFTLVQEKGIRTVSELQGLAARAANEGDASLAQFCAAQVEEKLNDLVTSSVAILQAPRAIAMRAATRMDLLRFAATEVGCACRGAWAPGALKVLENEEDVQRFCADVCGARTSGATRGTNIAVIGGPGCGKSMLFEPFDGIFKVMGKPQAKSSFPLAAVLDSVLLWQDWKHNDATILFEDLLSMLVGERMDIRVPNKKNAMTERFAARVWLAPLPQEARVKASSGHVKPRKSNKSSFGKNVNVAVAISAKKVLMCRVMGGRWNAATAAEMYQEALAPALRKANAKSRSVLILEDNDPTGYKAKLSKEAKEKVECIPFPKRSLDLNPLDYGFWSMINKRLRGQEAKFPPSKMESRAAFIRRLKRTIMRVPSATLEPLVQSMKRRCNALLAAKGADFEE
ncbi:unnamed protein product, partial [Prorocentrum cordatum]